MADPVGPIMRAIGDLLEGKAGSGRTMDADRFRLIFQDVETLPARGCARAPYPFNVRAPRAVPPNDAISSWTSGSHQEGSHELEVAVAYADRPEVLTLDTEIQEDAARIRRVLEWTPNWALTTGWCGLETLNTEIVPVAKGTEDLLVVLAVRLRVDHREDRS